MSWVYNRRCGEGSRGKDGGKRLKKSPRGHFQKPGQGGGRGQAGRSSRVAGTAGRGHRWGAGGKPAASAGVSRLGEPARGPLENGLRKRESSLIEQDLRESGRGSSACGSRFLRPALKAQGRGQWGQGAAGRVERPGCVDSIKWGQHRQGGQAGQVGPPSKSSSENEKPVLERRACAFVLISFYDIIISRQKVHAETPRFH